VISVLPDAVVTNAGTPVTINVLANDTGSELAITSFSNPANGSLVFNGDKTFTYTPASGFIGEDSFTYTVRDAQGTPANAEVTVSVVADTGATVATDDLAEVITGNGVVIPVLANDMAAGGGALQIIAVSTPGHGAVNVLPDQTIRYVPQSGFTGIDSFNYTVVDGLDGSASATVTVKVMANNSPPVAGNDTFTIEAGQPTMLVVLANDSDPDGGPLQVVGYTMPVHGQLVFNADNTFIYTPATGYLGNDQFTYTIRDKQGASASANVTLVVVEILEIPVAFDDQVTTEAGLPVTIDVLANDVLPAGQQIAIVAVTLPFKGNLAFKPDKTITYTPNSGFVGIDDFTYTIGNGQGGTAKAKVTVDVSPASTAAVYANGYAYRRRLVIPAGAAKGTSHENFPLWVELAGSWLKSTANGGKVASADGHDLRFELEGGTRLAHELEHYDAVAGKLGAWVRLPELGAEQPTVLLLYYGKPGLAASEAEPETVWQDYLAVWHLPEASDSSGQGRGLVAQGSVQSTTLGLGAGSVSLNGDGVLKIDDASWLDGLSALTVQLRGKAASIGHDRGLLGAGSALFTGDSDVFIQYQAVGLGEGAPRNVVHSKIRTTAGDLLMSSAANVQKTDWQSVALTWQSGEPQSHLYLDGTKVQPSYRTPINAAGTTRIDGPLYAGSGPDDGESGGWAGLLDEVRLRPSQLSSSWIAAEHANHDDPWAFYGIGTEDSLGDSSESPVAVPLALLTPAGTRIDIDVLGAAVLPSDATEPAITSMSQPTHGTVSTIDDKIRYTPTGGFSGEDSFTYTLSLAGKTSTAKIIVAVGAEAARDELYPAIVHNIPNLLAYWRCGSTDRLTDFAGSRHGTFNNTPGLVTPIAPKSVDGAIKLAGQRASVPHDAGLLLPAVTLSFWIRLDAAPSETASVFPIAKDWSGLNNGDFAIAFTGESELWARFQTMSGVAPGVKHPITIGVPFHAAVVCSSAGLALWVNGQLIGIDDTYTGGWSTNTAEIRFGSPLFSQFFADVTLDEIALYSRALAENEVLTLANKLTGVGPVVPDRGPFEVTGTDNLQIDLLAEVAYVGSSPTVTIVDKSTVIAAGHDVTVSDGIATFASIAVGSDETGLMFTYTVEDVNGTSNVGTVTINVRQTVAPSGGPLYQCYADSAADTVEVASMASLATAINAAPPGRNILIAPGTYTGGTYTFSPAGAENNPVVVRPRDGIGTVTVNSPTWRLTGSRFVLSGIYFNNSRIDVADGASFNRITRCQFRQIGGNSIQIYAATDTRIDHCDASEYLSSTNSKGFVRFRHTNIGDGTLKRLLIDQCYVHDITPGTGANGMEPIGQTSSSGGALFQNAGIIIEKCLIKNVSIPGEGEIFGLKSGGWIIRECTFENNSGMYLNMPRQGFDMTIRSCWFEGGRNPTLQAMSDNLLVIGNHFFGSQNCDIFAGNYTWDEIVALGTPPSTAYSVARNPRVIGNILDTGSIRLGQFWSNLTAVHRVSNAVLEANSRGGASATTSNGVSMLFETGTTIRATTEESYTPAVKLVPGDVGLFAPDAVCEAQ
jgi:hypothetical protein